MSLGILKSLKSVYTSLNPEHVRQMVAQPISVELVADTEERFAQMEAYLIPAITDPADRAVSLSRVRRSSESVHPGDADVTIYEQGVPCPRGAFTFYADDPERTIEEILNDKPDLEVALARNFIGFRRAAIHRIVGRIARENALFVLVTAMPNIVPNILELPWALGEYATDSAFLTVNQVRMAFLVGAASGRGVGLSEQKGEILSIIASAFGWRALARELAGKIPLGGGLAAKAAIAWAGTFVVGRGIEQVYLTGDRFRRNEHKEMYEKALEKGRQVASALLETFRKPSAA